MCSSSVREWERRDLGCLPSWLGAQCIGEIPVQMAGAGEPTRGTCCAIALGAGMCRSVCPAASSRAMQGQRAGVALPSLVRSGVQAVIRRGKDEVDITGGIPGCEERSLLC